MSHEKSLARAVCSVILSLAFACLPARSQVKDTGREPQQASRPRFVRAFICDDRLSALRRGPDFKAEVIQRLRLARPVYIIQHGGALVTRGPFCRIAVTRRTRGWIHQAALASPARRDDDRRLIALIERKTEGLDRLTLCRLFIDRFGRSPLVARALLLMGEEADRAAPILSDRAAKRLGDGADERASLSDLFLSDSGLDRYSRLGVNFDFDEASGEYRYDGRVYNELVRRFPSSEEAVRARQRLTRR